MDELDADTKVRLSYFEVLKCYTVNMLFISFYIVMLCQHLLYQGWLHFILLLCFIVNE